MENFKGKIYDIETKKEVSIKDVQPYKTYLYIEDNYCSTARYVGFDSSGKMIKESYISYEEQLKIATSLIEEKYKNMGFKDVQAKVNDVFHVAGMRLQVPHILTTYTGSDGKNVEKQLNINTMEEIVKIDDSGIYINLSNMKIGDNIEIDGSEHKARTKLIENIIDEGKTEENRETVNQQNEMRGSSILKNVAIGKSENFRLILGGNSNFQGTDMSGLESLAQNANCRVSIINQFGFNGEYNFSNLEDVKRFSKDIKTIQWSKTESMNQHEKEGSSIGNE